MKLSPQKQKILDLYREGDWVCSTAIHFIRDYRKRISEMSREGYTFRSLPCDGRCGVKHGSNVHMYRLEDAPKPQMFYVRHPLTGEKITTQQLASL